MFDLSTFRRTLQMEILLPFEMFPFYFTAFIWWLQLLCRFTLYIKRSSIKCQCCQSFIVKMSTFQELWKAAFLFLNHFDFSFIWRVWGRGWRIFSACDVKAWKILQTGATVLYVTRRHSKLKSNWNVHSPSFFVWGHVAPQTSCMMLVRAETICQLIS